MRAGWTTLFVTVLLGTTSLAATGATAAADPPADPVRLLEGKSKVEVDVALLIDDLLPLVLETMRAGAEYTEEGPTEVAARADRLSRTLDVLGVHALDRLRVETEVKADRERTHAVVTFDPGADAGVIGALAAVAPSGAEFGRHLDADDLDLLISVPTFARNLEALLDQLARPEVQEMLPELPVDETGEIVVGGLSLRHDLLPLLAGELHLLVLKDPPDAAPDAVPAVAVVIATVDAITLRDRLFQFAGALAADAPQPHVAALISGIEAGMRAMPVQRVGSFAYQGVPHGPAVATSDDWLVLTSDGTRFQQALATADGMDLPRCRLFARMPGEFLVKVLARLAARDEQPQPLLPMLRAAAAVQGFGVAELVAGARTGRLEVEARQTGRSTRILYGLLHDALAAAPARVAVEREQAWLTGTVSAVDAALAAWSEDHDGVYPEELSALADGGYLPFFPELTAVPLGDYREHAYTYVPLEDDDGLIAGYYFFIYGGGEGSGYDVFDDDNIHAGRAFVIAGDGRPDGVLHFSYDGIAVPQVEAWNERE